MAQKYLVATSPDGRLKLEPLSEDSGKLQVPSRRSPRHAVGEFWEGVVEHDTQPSLPRKGVKFVLLQKKLEPTPKEWAGRPDAPQVHSWSLEGSTLGACMSAHLKPTQDQIEQGRKVLLEKAAAWAKRLADEQAAFEEGLATGPYCWESDSRKVQGGAGFQWVTIWRAPEILAAEDLETLKGYLPRLDEASRSWVLRHLNPGGRFYSENGEGAYGSRSVTVEESLWDFGPWSLRKEITDKWSTCLVEIERSASLPGLARGTVRVYIWRPDDQQALKGVEVSENLPEDLPEDLRTALNEMFRKASVELRERLLEERRNTALKKLIEAQDLVEDILSQRTTWCLYTEWNSCPGPSPDERGMRDYGSWDTRLRITSSKRRWNISDSGMYVEHEGAYAGHYDAPTKGVWAYALQKLRTARSELLSAGGSLPQWPEPGYRAPRPLYPLVSLPSFTKKLEEINRRIRLLDNDRNRDKLSCRIPKPYGEVGAKEVLACLERDPMSATHQQVADDFKLLDKLEGELETLRKEEDLQYQLEMARRHVQEDAERRRQEAAEAPPLSREERQRIRREDASLKWRTYGEDKEESPMMSALRKAGLK